MVLESSTVSIFLGIYNAPGVELGNKAEVGIGFAKGWRGIHDREPATVHFERAGGCNKELDGLCAEAFDGRGIQRQKCGLGNERLDLCIEVTHGGSVEHVSQIVTNLTLFERQQLGTLCDLQALETHLSVDLRRASTRMDRLLKTEVKFALRRQFHWVGG